MTSWILVWVYLSYAGDLTTRIPYAAVKEVVLDSQRECEEALIKQMDKNDTRYMMAVGDAQLVCVPVPLKWDPKAGKIVK